MQILDKLIFFWGNKPTTAYASMIHPKNDEAEKEWLRKRIQKINRTAKIEYWRRAFLLVQHKIK